MIELSGIERSVENGETEDYMCRICLDEGERRDFIAPCRCSGTSKWVHRNCLDRWRSIREDKAFSQCMECHANYEIVCVSSSNSDGNQCNRRMTFCALVTRDLGLLLAALVLIIMIITLIVYFFDLELHHYMLNMLGMEQYPLLCYMSLSIALILAYIGTHFGCVYMRICSPPSMYHSSSMGGTCRCCDDVMFVPYYVTPDLQPSCCCLECGHCSCCCCDTCGNAAAAGSAETSTGATSACSCCECAGAEAGHELLIVVLVLFVVLAIIGLLVAVFVGTVIMQSILSKHLHVLGKWTMTKEYVVKDLAEDAAGVVCESGMSRPVESDYEDPDGHEEPPSFVDFLYATWGNRNNRRSAVRRGIHFNYQSVEHNST